ncbi:MAG: hypothetical protein KIT34_10620 [Cyanobacteria bacterium TGS_CYA1]|nr:hypothetical protein [Cyanobacteria bacterium TGS_CYA1]
MKRMRKLSRKQKGVSLILVIVMGTVAALMALAVMDSLIAAYRSIANRLGSQEITGAAESSAQYSIAYINQYAAENGGDVHAILDTPILVPSEVSGSYLQSPPMVKSLSNPDTSPGWTAFQNSAIWDSNNPSTDYLRLNVVATNGIDKSGVTVILGPNGYGKNLPTGKNSFFSNAILSSNSTTLGTNVNIALPDKSNIPDAQERAKYYSQTVLQSNGTLNLNGNSIGGSISGLDGITSDASSKIFGNVHSTNLPNNVFTPETNVLGDASSSGIILGSVDNNVSASDMVPAPTPKSNGNANVDLNSKQISPGGDSSQVYDLGSALVLNNSTSMTIKPGNYIADSVNIAPESTLIIDTSSNQPVNIYVRGKTADDSSISISADGISYSQPSSAKVTSVQLYYNGSKKTAIDLSNSFNGLVFAPKSDITITNVSSNTIDLNSAVVGKNVSVLSSQGKINWTYDPTSTNASLGQGGGGNNPIPGYNDLRKPTFFNVLSWQELSKSQLP